MEYIKNKKEKENEKKKEKENKSKQIKEINTIADILGRVTYAKIIYKEKK